MNCYRHSWPVHIWIITTTSNFSSVVPHILQVSTSDSDSLSFHAWMTIIKRHHQFMIQVINLRRLVQYTRELIQSVPLLEKLQNFFYFYLTSQVDIGHIPASYGRSISSDPDLSRLCESLTKDWPVLTGLFPFWDIQFVLPSLTKTTLAGWSKSVVVVVFYLANTVYSLCVLVLSALRFIHLLSSDRYGALPGSMPLDISCGSIYMYLYMRKLAKQVFHQYIIFYISVCKIIW